MQCFSILDTPLTNIVDIGRESVHDVNKIRARRTKTNKDTAARIFSSLLYFSWTDYNVEQNIPRHGLSIFFCEPALILSERS